MTLTHNLHDHLEGTKGTRASYDVNVEVFSGALVAELREASAEQWAPERSWPS